ncbi:MAG TPA: adenylate/guanylate cyclase domain-containing protein [Geminicoccaceae bacterium]|nr:adenylate/guanylate cyclase domain-containing protein [Geminicoccus sp.]HMU48756.1 adenylate/guanylate cyclase domain-containing protein [Geminicoccaceae bacterium]
MPAPGRLLARAARLLVALAVASLVILAELRLSQGPVLGRLELQTLDWRFRLRGPAPPAEEVVLVVIDDRTVAELGRWPAPRGVIAEAVDRIRAAGAAVIAVDLLLSEPARNLPEELTAALDKALAALPADSSARRELAEAALGADPDQTLASSLREAGSVAMAYAFVFAPGENNVDGVPAEVRATAYPVYTQAAGAVSPEVDEVRGLIVPAPALREAAGTLGHVTVLVDQDGAVRYERPVFPFAGELFPSLSVEAVRLYDRLPRERVVVRLGEGLEIGSRRLRTDAGMRHYVNYYGPTGTLPTYPLADLLDGSIDVGVLRGRIVLLGATAAGAGDRFVTPFAERLPGVEYLATAVANMLDGRSLLRDSRTAAVTVLAIVLMTLLGAMLAGRRSYSWSLAVTLGLLAGWWGLAQLAFVERHWWLGIVTPSLALLLAAGTVEGIRVGAEQRRRRRLERQRANLGRYFPPTVVERLASADRPSELERTQPAAVMFVDIVGFTRISEPMSPGDAMALLREFHTRVERAVFAHGGMVDKFMGDGALACFGVPDPGPGAAADALRAARALLTDLAGWNIERSFRGEPPVRAGIGIHHGDVLMGDIGGRRQFQFTVIGDTVNVASRLESMTRQHAADLVVSESVVDEARRGAGGDPDVLAGLEPLAELPVRGREGTIRAWRLPYGRLPEAERT